MSEVLVVGAGPVGLTMAAELARHGVRSRIIDKLQVPSPYCRALGITPRTLEVWDDMGIARDMINAGLWSTGLRVIVDGQTKDIPLDLSDLPYGMLSLPQYETERLLTRHLESFGLTIERGVSLESLTQANGQVHVTLANAAGEREERTYRHVVGCDGAHSAVRKALGIAFEGDAFPAQFVLGDVHIDWDLPRGMALRSLRPVEDAAPDMFIAIPMPEPGRYRVSMLAPPELDAAGGTDHGIQSERSAPGIEYLQAVANWLLPQPGQLSDLRWSSSFRISMRLAANYRKGNAFIAGDAAHIHPPTGGQGMNTGIQDAYNLAWKLALVLNGSSPESLLESYEAERRPVGEEVVASTTRASTQLGREQGPPHRLAETQLLVNYRSSAWVGGGIAAQGPSPGDRMPDCNGLRRAGIGYPLRLFDILRGTRHVLLTTDASASLRSLDRARVQQVAIVDMGQASSDLFERPTYTDAAGEFRSLIGPGAAALLIRPDGYVAWRGASVNDPTLHQVFERTFRM